MNILDFHTHILSPDMVRQRDAYLQRDTWFRLLYASPKARIVTADQLVQAMDKGGIQRAVTFGFAWADSALCAASNDYVADALRRYPDRLIGFAVVNPADGDRALYEAERCLSMGFRGVGELMPDGQGYSLDDRDVMAPIMGFLEAHGLPLLIHTSEPVGHAYPGRGTTNPGVVYHLAQRYPEVKIVCAHWGGGVLFYELMPRARHVLTNVYYDLAAAPYLYDCRAYQLAAQVAPHKLLFATDYPLLGYSRCLQHFQEAGLSDDQAEAILSGNAERVLAVA